ncbi:phosphatidylcholine transfer protein-like [Liolophura sinensis]|uniref:phosphatidylcholine transfer protein-like n=1 Tax=Liolophura sinensis TaxID=3198878 RepID=UPI00315938D9
MFQDEEFTSACRELEGPQVEGWEFFTESHDVTIYRLYNEESGLYQYKIYGSIDVDPDTCAKVYMDIDYRRQWDSYVNVLKEVEIDGETAVYWNINFPWPMSNRDYIYKRELRELDFNGSKVYVVLAKSVATDKIPEKSGVVRVDDYHQSAALKSDGKGGTKAYMRYYDNPKGMIPTWLINWAAKTGVPQFLGTMQTACRGYDKYLQSRTQS